MYLLFAFTQDEALGGWQDYRGAFQTIDDAIIWYKANQTIIDPPLKALAYEAGHIVDVRTMSIVEYL